MGGLELLKHTCKGTAEISSVCDFCNNYITVHRYNMLGILVSGKDPVGWVMDCAMTPEKI